MRLNFVAPVIMEGKPIPSLDKNEVKRLSEIWVKILL